VEDSPAALATTQVGDYRNIKELSEFARGVDVLTFDHEHVPTPVLIALRDAGVTVAPSPEALALTHDKIVMRKSLSTMGAPQPALGCGEGVDGLVDADAVGSGGLPLYREEAGWRL